MDTIPDDIVNKKLYAEIKKEADAKYKRPGLYKSAWLVKTYKDRGGKYTGERKTSGTGIRRWLEKEEWIQVLPYLLQNKKIVCGSSSGDNIACRPYVRANSKTPITLPELLKIHTREKLIELAKEKQKYPNKRINWKAGTIK